MALVEVICGLVALEEVIYGLICGPICEALVEVCQWPSSLDILFNLQGHNCRGGCEKAIYSKRSHI